MTELWRELGGYVAMREEGTDMVVAQAGIHYYAALGFDDPADLIVRKIQLGNTSMTSTLAIERDGETIAEGELRHVFVDLAKGETRPIPERIREGLARYS
jgi:acyl-CoA thioester hydrolase